MDNGQWTKKGFTLVELLVAISILAILSVVGMTIYSQIQTRARDAKRIGDIDSISKAFEVHYSNGVYPQISANWFDSGISTDPKNDTTYFYSLKGKDSDGTVTGGTSGVYPTTPSVSFTICAELENSTGNATAGTTTNPDGTTTTSATAGDGTTFTLASGNGTHFCKKNLQ